MNASKPNNALGQYRKTDAHGAAAADDRLQLIVHMMQGALDRVATARGHMQRHEVAEKGQEIFAWTTKTAATLPAISMRYTSTC
jgi:flagellar protein FliS